MLFPISKRGFLASTVAAASLFWPSLARAQEAYPNQNVRFLVAFPAGGPTDAIARILGERLTEKWGQSVVIENRGGAGGNIAARQVAKAEPNGYTVLVTTSAYAVNPSLTANAGYVPETDFKTAVVAATTPEHHRCRRRSQGVQSQGAARGREDREIHLRHAGARHHAAPLGREDLQGAGQGRHSACAVHRRGAASQRAARRAHNACLSRHAADDRAHQERSNQGAGRDQRQAGAEPA